MKAITKAFLTAMTLPCLLGLFPIQPALAEESVKVTVSILPQKFFVEKMGGNWVDVTVMVLPGANPATYEPKPQQMVQLAKSSIYFAIGVPFETVWLPKFKNLNTEMTIVRTQAGIEKVPMKAHLHEPLGSHDDHETRGHVGIRDPHIWLSPPLVMLQARNILEGLLKIAPGHRDLFEANYGKFIQELVDLDVRIMNRFKGEARGSRFMVYHPAWGYFARAYGLKQIPVELEGKEPSPRDLQELIVVAKKDGIKAVFVQPQFSIKSADTIAKAIGGRVVAADPLALDWAENLEAVAASFAAVLK